MRRYFVPRNLPSGKFYVGGIRGDVSLSGRVAGANDDSRYLSYRRSCRYRVLPSLAGATLDERPECKQDVQRSDYPYAIGESVVPFDLVRVLV